MAFHPKIQAYQSIFQKFSLLLCLVLFATTACATNAKVNLFSIDNNGSIQKLDAFDNQNQIYGYFNSTTILSTAKAIADKHAATCHINFERFKSIRINACDWITIQNEGDLNADGYNEISAATFNLSSQQSKGYLTIYTRKEENWQSLAQVEIDRKAWLAGDIHLQFKPNKKQLIITRKKHVPENEMEKNTQHPQDEIIQLIEITNNN